MARRYKKIAGMKVNAKRCASCPFNEDGCQVVKQSVEARCLTEASQTCHETHDKTLCRGARDYQIQIFHRLGLLKEPTDECWQKTLQEVKNENRQL